MAISVTADARYEKLISRLMDDGHLVDIDEMKLRDLLPNISLKYRDFFGDEGVKHKYSWEKTKYWLKNYFKTYDKKKEFLELFVIYHSKAQENPLNGEYLRKSEYFRKLYMENKLNHDESKAGFYESLKQAIATQINMSKISRYIPKPNDKAIKERLQLDLTLPKLPGEGVIVVTIIVAFSLFFVYLKNPPGTVGYASLPNYGVTTIFLSIIILAALLYLFRKVR